MRLGFSWVPALLVLMAAGHASGQVETLARTGFGNSTSWNWPTGTWEVAAVLFDANGQPVGGLSAGFSTTLPGTLFPAGVTVDMLASAPDTSHKIRVYRVQGTLESGTFGADYAAYSCDAGGGVIADFCDAVTSASLIAGTGCLREPDFLGTGTVPGGGEGVGELARTGFGNSPSWNWPAGTWEVAAVLLDSNGQPVGGLSPGFSTTLPGTLYPAGVSVDMLASAPNASHRIRVLRKQGAILGPRDRDAEIADFPCDDGGGGIAAICDADSAASYIDGEIGQLRDPDFSPMMVPVPSLGAAGTVLLLSTLLGVGAALLAGGRTARS